MLQICDTMSLPRSSEALLCTAKLALAALIALSVLAATSYRQGERVTDRDISLHTVPVLADHAYELYNAPMDDITGMLTMHAVATLCFSPVSL